MRLELQWWKASDLRVHTINIWAMELCVGIEPQQWKASDLWVLTLNHWAMELHVRLKSQQWRASDLWVHSLIHWAMEVPLSKPIVLCITNLENGVFKRTNFIIHAEYKFWNMYVLHVFYLGHVGVVVGIRIIQIIMIKYVGLLCLLIKQHKITFYYPG